MSLMAGLAAIAAIPVFFLREVLPSKDEVAQTNLFAMLSAAITLNARDTTILLLAPFNLTFGFMSALVGQSLNKSLATDVLGKSSIGVLSSVTVGIATVLSIPISRFSDHKALLVAEHLTPPQMFHGEWRDMTLGWGWVLGWVGVGW